jgi:histidine ammonia-lyase
LFIIKTIASASKRDVWKFINPSLNAKPTLLALADPLTATFIVAKKTTLAKLTANKRETYKDNNLRISMQLKALSKIQDYIINNISSNNIKII